MNWKLRLVFNYFWQKLKQWHSPQAIYLCFIYNSKVNWEKIIWFRHHIMSLSYEQNHHLLCRLNGWIWHGFDNICEKYRKNIGLFTVIFSIVGTISSNICFKSLLLSTICCIVSCFVLTLNSKLNWTGLLYYLSFFEKPKLHSNNYPNQLIFIDFFLLRSSILIS